MFFPILVNTIVAVKNIDPNLVRAARSLGAPEHKVLARIVLKGALPQIITGVRIGLGVGWMALVAAELVGANSGLGFLINDARSMQAQQKISARRLRRKIGTRQKVIIDEVGPTVAKGRSMADAPEIDGAVYVASRRPLRVGEIATVKIERADEYDLHGAAVGF